MNKHMIILPVLLAAGAALHILSIKLEAQEEIANQANMQVSTNVVTQQNTTASSAPVQQPGNTVTVPVDKGNAAQPAKSAAPGETKTTTAANTTTASGTETKTVVPAVTSKPAATTPTGTNTQTAATQPASTAPATTTPAQPAATTTTTTATTTSSVQVASALIPSKNMNEIVREAKVIGGRVDPFLSMKPPEMEKLPELPSNFQDTAIASKPATADNTVKGQVPNPPTAWVPDFKETKPVKNPKVTAKSSKGKTKNAGKGKTKEEDMIVFAPETKLEEGLVLTGIITGSKPLALVTVDNTNKVFSVGDVIRPDSKTRIVSIDFDTQAITLADEKNRRAKLEIKE
jgi:hypothetical protein